MNKKRCQIRTTSPVTCFTVPIVGTTELNLTHDEIYKCLCAKAEVIEILADGKRIHLDFTNYNKDNYWTNNPIGEPIVKETSDSIIDIAYNYTKDSIESTPAVFNTEDTDNLGSSNSLGEINAIEDSLESVIYTVEEVIEEREIIPQIAEVKETTEEEVEVITTIAEIEDINAPMTEEDIKKPVSAAKTVTASTVSNYQVASRNNNKKKNNNHKK